MKADDKDVLCIQMGRVQLALIVAQVAFNITIIANMRCRYNCYTNYFSHCKYVSYIPMVRIKRFCTSEEHSKHCKFNPISWTLFSPQRWMKRLIAKHQSKITTATTPTFIKMSPLIICLMMMMTMMKMMMVMILASSLFIGLPGGSPSGPSSVTSASPWWSLWWWSWWLWWWWWLWLWWCEWQCCDYHEDEVKLSFWHFNAIIQVWNFQFRAKTCCGHSTELNWVQTFQNNLRILTKVQTCVL